MRCGRDAMRCGRDFVFINRRKRRAVPHHVASQGNATYCEPGLRRLPPRQNACAKLQIQQLLFSIEFQETSDAPITYQF